MGRGIRGADELFYGEELEEDIVLDDVLQHQGVVGMIDHLGLLLQRDLRHPKGHEIDEQFGVLLVSKNRNFTLRSSGPGETWIDLDLAEGEEGFVLEVAFCRNQHRAVVYSGCSAESAARAARNASDKEGISGWESFDGDQVREIIETALRNYS